MKNIYYKVQEENDQILLIRPQSSHSTRSEFFTTVQIIEQAVKNYGCVVTSPKTHCCSKCAAGPLIASVHRPNIDDVEIGFDVNPA